MPGDLFLKTRLGGAGLHWDVAEDLGLFPDKRDPKPTFINDVEEYNGMEGMAIHVGIEPQTG